VVKGKDVKIAGSLQRKTETGKMLGGVPMHLSRASGQGGRGGHKHNEFVGKTVRIRSGNDKGLLGTVVEGGSAELFRIELYARNKIITVPKTNLAFEDPRVIEQQPVLLEEVRSFGGQSSNPGSFYPQTPMHETSDHRPLQLSRSDSTGSSSFRKGDSVRLIDTGETVVVYEVVDRDIVVSAPNGKIKIVAASNVVYA